MSLIKDKKGSRTVIAFILVLKNNEGESYIFHVFVYLFVCLFWSFFVFVLVLRYLDFFIEESVTATLLRQLPI